MIGCGRTELIGQNHLHLQTGNPANQRAARAHLSLDNENDHEVKIDFNCCEDPTAQAHQKGRSDDRKSLQSGEHFGGELTSFCFVLNS